jgi:flagellin-like hook-associated protein FlgL
MANLGISNASYYTDRFITKLNKEVDHSVNRLSTARKDVSASDIASLKSMDYTFRLDVASTKAAVKSMSITQAYLSTAITSLDNASAILARIQELAVLGANSTNTSDQQAALTVEAEALADEFHKSMSSADFKGKLVFDVEEDNQTGTMSLGKNSAGSANFGIGEIDYDFFYDYKNPSTDRYNTGLLYEITSELTDAEKTALLSRLPGATEEDLVVGYQFVAEAQEKVGEGLEVADLTYNRAEGAKQFDALASFAQDGEFDGYHLEFQVSENSDASDNLSIEDTANVRVLDVGDADNPFEEKLIQYYDAFEDEWIDVAKIDSEKDGVDGTVLRLNILSDATIPDTSELKNGDFGDLIDETVSYTPQYSTRNLVENRDGVVSGLSDSEGNAIDIVDNIAAPTYSNVSLGEDGVRVNILTEINDEGTEVIAKIEIIDGWKGNSVNDNLQIGETAGENLSGTTLTVSSVLDNQDITLTRANIRTETTTTDVVWPEGTEDGFYEFDATGQPAEGDDRLSFSAGEVKKIQTSREVQVGTGEFHPETGAELTVAETRYGIRDDVITTVDGTTYEGEITRTEDYISGYTPNIEEAPEYWTRFEGRVNFGENFEIKQFPTDAIRLDPDDQNNELDAANGIVDIEDRERFQIPTPSEAVMIATADGPGHDDTALGAIESDMQVSINGGKLNLNTGEFFFEGTEDDPRGAYGILHGPAAVSDVFPALEGQFLKLDYSATGESDDYHVAGYIYRVNDDGTAASDPIMVLNETGTSVTDRKSIEVPEDGNYRFVFIVGTYDKTGGLLAGADMTIDNIVAENPYAVDSDVISGLLQALHFSNQSANAAPSKVLSTSLLEGGTENVLITDLSDINITGVSGQPAGPFMEIAGRNLVTVPGDALSENNSSVLTAKIEAVQEEINSARVRAASQMMAISSAIESSTDLRSQFSLGSGTLSELNFSSESAYLARRQIQHDIATAMLAQANLGQSHLISLLAE